jgi:hypothetical protein
MGIISPKIVVSKDGHQKSGINLLKVWMRWWKEPKVASIGDLSARLALR